MSDMVESYSKASGKELAKTYEGRDTASFVNGILATFIQQEKHE